MMKKRWIACAGSAGAIALSLAFTAPARPVAPAAPGAIGIGDVASYKFRESLVNGMGVASLEDLRGKPVLFDFWGMR